MYLSNQKLHQVIHVYLVEIFISTYQVVRRFFKKLIPLDKSIFLTDSICILCDGFSKIDGTRRSFPPKLAVKKFYERSKTRCIPSSTLRQNSPRSRRNLFSPSLLTTKQKHERKHVSPSFSNRAQSRKSSVTRTSTHFSHFLEQFPRVYRDVSKIMIQAEKRWLFFVQNQVENIRTI